jgi:hypothetical protein
MLGPLGRGVVGTLAACAAAALALAFLAW